MGNRTFDRGRFGEGERRGAWRKGIALLLLLVGLLGLGLGRRSFSGQAQERDQPLVERRRETLPIPALPEGATWTSAPLSILPPPGASLVALATAWAALPGPRPAVALRTSEDGEQWSPWAPLELEEGPLAADPSERGSSAPPERNGFEWEQSLTLLSGKIRYVQYRLPGAASPAPARLEVGWFFPPATSLAARQRIERRANGEQIPDLELQAGPLAPTTPIATPRPPVITRTEWGCPDGQVTRHGTLRYTTVTHLIVHHTVNSNTSADWPAVVRSIWSFHIFDRGYSDIGYNYLIDPNGVIYEGRSGGDNVLGAHFSGVNAGTMGVALIGTFTSGLPTLKARESLRRLLAWKADQRGLIPYTAAPHASSGLSLKVIAGHRDGPSPTECPGQVLYLFLPQLRVEVLQEMTGSTALTTVSAADFAPRPLAPDSIAASFGRELSQAVEAASATPLPSTLGGISLRVRDASEKEWPVPLFHVSPGQVNLLVPAELALGPATLLLSRGDTLRAAGLLALTDVAPALFTANATGQGAPAAILLRLSAGGVATYESTSQYDAALQSFVPRPILFGPETEVLYLVLFGTGIRARGAGTTSRSVDAQLISTGGLDLLNTSLEVTYAGPTREYAGLDQLNLQLPRALSGQGARTLRVTVEGVAANSVLLQF
ncbi:MAG: N-acetylmuramoyl-L-alanine amidase [Blastocatellia bacterium]